ncbi:5,10-methylenetetrahydromethanopterin reductase [Halosegnis longus]|uniref:5,10-methylenetetrahydromethanopterin reductase n=1 Tax=Halosegnis longus TaxID=2216012 RepID=A0AAJ4UV60_9EURY|nr:MULTISPECIES: 5,10-methylenetetrahydromethanopterin reductase [Halobacteriales]RNJ25628.1 5,10-methylenetetrahydromethanopterin reductase [Salella cibi]
MLGIELTPEHPVSRLGDLGARAETAGFDTIFCSSHYNNRDPFVALDRIARRTDTARVGPGVANPYDTHPLTLAGKVATLDESSGGRAVFGIGPGDPSTLRNLGVEREQGLSATIQAFKDAQRVWAGERVSRDGVHTAADAGLNFEPPQGGDIPVYVGGEGPHMCRMAGKHADGLLFNGSHPDDLAWARDRVEEGKSDRPDERGAFELSAYASVSVAEAADAARAAARPPVAFIASGAAPPVLQRHGIDPEVADAIGDAIAAGNFEAAFEQVTEPMVEAFCIAGTPETVAARAEKVLEHADSLVVGSPLGPELETAIDLAGETLS